MDHLVFIFLFAYQKISNKSLILLCDKYGNIGNQLYMSCFLIKWAEEFNIMTFNFGLIQNQHFFTKPSNDILLRYPFKKSFKLYKLQEILASSMNRISLRFLRLKSLKNIKSLDLLNINTKHEFRELESQIQKNNITFLRGFIHNQHYSIFRSIFCKIKDYFEIYSCYENDIMEPIDHLKDCDIIVGVAIRHGDYKTWQDGKYYLAAEIYEQWMEKVVCLFKSRKVGFFIASDEEQDLSIFDKHKFFFRSGHPIENLYCLSNCDFLLSVPSSFAGWAHFIGKTPIFNLHAKVRNLSSTDFKNW